MLGSIIGAPIAGYLVDRLGRKAALATNVIPYLIGYLITLMSSLVQHGVTFKVLLVSGRLIAGIGQGWTYVVVPVSISLPARTSEQGNVIGLVSVYIYIYVYMSSKKL